jgi:hypothetical protein
VNTSSNGTPPAFSKLCHQRRVPGRRRRRTHDVAGDSSQRGSQRMRFRTTRARRGLLSLWPGVGRCRPSLVSGALPRAVRHAPSASRLRLSETPRYKRGNSREHVSLGRFLTSPPPPKALLCDTPAVNTPQDGLRSRRSLGRRPCRAVSRIRHVALGQHRDLLGPELLRRYPPERPGVHPFGLVSHAAF